MRRTTALICTVGLSVFGLAGTSFADDAYPPQDPTTTTSTTIVDSQSPVTTTTVKEASAPPTTAGCIRSDDGSGGGLWLAAACAGNADETGARCDGNDADLQGGRAVRAGRGECPGAVRRAGTAARARAATASAA